MTSRLSRFGGGNEPVDNADERLAWYASRARAWLDAASTISLMDTTEPFELLAPLIADAIQLRVVHDEGTDTWPTWKTRTGQTGRVEWGVLPGLPKTVVARRLVSANGDTLREFRRRLDVEDSEPWTGSWWLWPTPIVLEPWQAPATWGELRRAGQSQGVDVDAALHALAKRHRGEKNVLLLLGYPIPDRWHGEAKEVHWQCALFPDIPDIVKPANGFRNNDKGRWQTLRTTFFAGQNPLVYFRSSSWHPDRLQARGRMRPSLTDRSICVIGAGALGSALAELLVRGGCSRVRLIDGEDLEAGNLVRHVLTADSLDRNKAEALAERLRLAAPTANIEAVGSGLPTTESSVHEILDEHDVVCDCTADDTVVRSLTMGRWMLPKTFLSASLGYGAKRLFLFEALGCTFPGEDFLSQVGPWLETEHSAWQEAGETLEGAGCWSPLFPARSDDVWLAAVATAKHLERVVAAEPCVRARLRVLEQMQNDGFGFVYRDDVPNAPSEEP